MNLATIGPTLTNNSVTSYFNLKRLEGRHLMKSKAHDTQQDGLPVLRTLPSFAPADHLGNYYLACAGGLLAAVTGPKADQSGRHNVPVWRVDEHGEETHLHTLGSFESRAASVSVCVCIGMCMCVL